MNDQGQEITVRHFGVEPYEPIWRDMQTFTSTRTKETGDEFWCLQHEPVFTLGQAGKSEHIHNSHQVPVVKCDRGGQVTYHGPGQLVIYLLINLRRRTMGARNLVDVIEQSLISVLGSYGVNAVVREGAPGVYVDDRKIAALGLRVRKGCSYHGLSLNISMDQAPFTWINPCGYEGLESTQLSDLVNEPGPQLFAEAEQKLIRELERNLLQYPV